MPQTTTAGKRRGSRKDDVERASVDLAIPLTILNITPPAGWRAPPIGYPTRIPAVEGQWEGSQHNPSRVLDPSLVIGAGYVALGAHPNSQHGWLQSEQIRTRYGKKQQVSRHFSGGCRCISTLARTSAIPSIVTPTTVGPRIRRHVDKQRYVGM